MGDIIKVMDIWRKQILKQESRITSRNHNKYHNLTFKLLQFKYSVHIK